MTSRIQERYLGVTNAAEGVIFVNETITENMTLAEYVAQLVPQFNATQIDATVAQYTGIGLNTVYDQAVAIMGDCTSCP